MMNNEETKTSALEDEASPATTEDANNNDTKSPSSSVPCKKDRRRLKKLKNKTQQQPEGLERSGILTRSEWIEYLQLEKETTTNSRVGPAIRRRKRQQISIIVDGTSHRDILACLLNEQNGSLQATNQLGLSKKEKKKRSRGEWEDPIRHTSLPGWVNFHNPGTLGHVAVLELHVPNVEEYSLKLSSIMDENIVNYQSIPTNWFQGPTARSSSESLLYFNLSSSSSGETTKLEESSSSSSPSRKLIVEKLQELILTKEELSHENYPIATSSTSFTSDNEKFSSDDSISVCSTIQQPSTIPIDEAKSLIQQLGVRVDNQNKEDIQQYIATQSHPSTLKETRGRLFGVDCEMVKTAIGSELARITLVEFQGVEDDQIQTTTILDALVKPYNDIKDYVTAYSGITAKLLENVSTRLEQIQVVLFHLLTPQDILVGHSLENDLHALHYIHPTVIDTALLFRLSSKSGSNNTNGKSRGCKFSLRHLVGALLQRKIQTDSHCSEVDAVAALELAVRRAWQGESFGIRGENRQCLLNFLPSQHTAVCIGPGPWLNTHVTRDANSIHALNYESISDCQRAMLGWLTGNRKAQLVWARLNPESSSSQKDIVLDEMMNFVSNLVSKMPATAILLITLQQSCRTTKELAKKRRACKDPRSCSFWTTEQEVAYMQQVDACRSGVVIWVGAKSKL